MNVAAQAPSPLRQFLSLILAGLRGMFFLPIRLEARDGGWGHIVAMLGLALAMQFAMDWAWVGPAGAMAWTGVADVLLVLPVVMLGAWAAGRLAGRRDLVPHLMALFVAIALVFAIFTHFLHAAVAYKWTLGSVQIVELDAPAWLAWVWYGLSCGVAGVRALAPSRMRSLVALLATELCIAVPLVLINPAPVLWTEPMEPDGAARDALATEDLFYLQPMVLERELAALRPSGKGGPELYLLVVAGDASQDVFMKEADYVATLFEQRFSTQGHTVQLINNVQSAHETPIASVTSLQRALKRIGTVMDPSKDILFLYLTSHGSPDHKFALQFGTMQFKELDPQRLRELLDQSGIRRRVLVISACYSGGFVDALKSDDTLVIAAAAADRSSFGCSNEADFTYFGKAYFEEALNRTTSFTQAFELATASVAAREKADAVEPSKPQMSVGANIGAALEQFEKGLSP